MIILHTEISTGYKLILLLVVVEPVQPQERKSAAAETMWLDEPQLQQINAPHHCQNKSKQGQEGLWITAHSSLVLGNEWLESSEEEIRLSMEGVCPVDSP